MPKTTYDNHVEKDEYHFNGRIAAFYADSEALFFARKVYKESIARLEQIKDRSTKEQFKLDELRLFLKDVEQKIKDRENTDPED